MKFARVILASLFTLGLAATASAKNYTITPPIGSLGRNTGLAFGDSYSFTLNKATDLDVLWSSANLYLNVVLYKRVGSSFISQVSSNLSAGSFDPLDLSKGKYVLDFFGGKVAPGKSSYQFSVLTVPEADTWAMLILGGGLIGYQLRRKHKLLPRQPISAG